MFGKTRDDSTSFDGPTIEDFFGDETAAEDSLQICALRERVVQVESQISSQFTSLATYAQIAQEQIELARSEAKATTERSEHRLTELIERERADRIHSTTGQAPTGSMPDVNARLAALEHDVAQIKRTLDECFEQQKTLADAITRLFELKYPAPPTVSAALTAGSFASPPATPPASLPAPESAGPIAGLSFNLGTV